MWRRQGKRAVELRLEVEEMPGKAKYIKGNAKGAKGKAQQVLAYWERGGFGEE